MRSAANPVTPPFRLHLVDVIAVEPTVVYRLTPQALRAIGAKRPMLADGLHRWVAQVLATRAAHLVAVVDTLE